ncbi:hypothetical protein PRSY57_1323000, partial [Plasmodium reichenowi]
NFMVRIKANNGEVNDFIKYLFTETFCNKDFADNIKLDAQKTNEKQESEKKNRYIITKKYVDNYMIPYLIRNNESGEEKRNENINSYDEDNNNNNNYYYNNSYNYDIFKYISCDIHIKGKHIVSSEYRNNIEDNTYKNRIQFELYGSEIYFKDMINEKYKIKYNKYNKKYIEYNIKDKSVLLIYGDWYMCDTFIKNEKSNISIKKLYDYIEENVENINEIFNCLKGSFILFYIHYDITNINVYFFNDQFGMKSFIYFYEEKSIILTNIYGPFLHYNYNYMELNKNEFIFNDMSVKDEMNLITTYDTFVQHDNIENNFLIHKKKTCDYNIINNKFNNIVSKERHDDKCSKKTINEEIAINIMPHYIYKLILLNNKEKNINNNNHREEDNIFNIHNHIMLNKINKQYCIYDNSYYQWKHPHVDKFNILNVQDILHYFEKTNIFKNFKKQQKIQFLHTINKIIQEKNKQSNTHKENINVCQNNYLYNTNKNNIHYTILNNVFINLFIILLNHIIRQKIERFFHLTCSGKKEEKMEKGKDEKKNNDGEKKNNDGEKKNNDGEKKNIHDEKKNMDGNDQGGKSHIQVEEDKNDNMNFPYYAYKEKCIGIFFSGGIDSTLLTILTIKNFFHFYPDGYIELVNVVFNINAIDRYTCFLSYEKIIRMFPNYDIRLILVDVYPDDLIKYEKIIYSIISPNNKIMDFNISSALFFANLGRGFLCPRTFFESQEWRNIKEENIMNVLNVSHICTSNKHTSDNNLWEENSLEKKICVKGKRKKETTSSSNINILYKCRICKYVMNKKCVHKCCSVCCKKLRYICINENVYNIDKEINSNGCDNDDDNDDDNNDDNNDDDNNDDNNNNEKDFIGMYEIQYNKENKNKKNIYLIVKKERILINFELFRQCSIHKDKLYDYKKIGYLFSEFKKELKKDKMNKKQEYKENKYQEEIIKNKKHPLCDEEYKENKYHGEIIKNKEHPLCDEEYKENKYQEEIIKNKKHPLCDEEYKENKYQEEIIKNKKHPLCDEEYKENKYQEEIIKNKKHPLCDEEYKENKYQEEIIKNKKHPLCDEEYKENKYQEEIIKNKKHPLCDEEYIQRDFIHQFAFEKSEINEKHNLEKIKNLFSSKGKNKKEGKKNNKNKMFIDNDNIYDDSNEDGDERQKKEKTKSTYNDTHLNYFNKNTYYRNHNYDNEKEKSFYICNHKLLIIGSGADELFGGYYRQNNFNKKLGKINKNYKMYEMIKDIRRIWIRNLYRDDRVITFSSLKKKNIFYPYLDMLMINFLFSLPFCIIETPIGYINTNEDNINICHKNEKLNYDDEEILHIQEEKEESYNILNTNYMNDHTLIYEEQFNYLNTHILNQCNYIYERIQTEKINKWILRMSMYFLNFKDVMFFKKKAIQFGSKSKNVKRYMKESLGIYPKDS